jgi:hypothetical protein
VVGQKAPVRHTQQVTMCPMLFRKRSCLLSISGIV